MRLSLPPRPKIALTITIGGRDYHMRAPTFGEVRADSNIFELLNPLFIAAKPNLAELTPDELQVLVEALCEASKVHRRNGHGGVRGRTH